MTINQLYSDWTQSGLDGYKPPFEKCSPNLDLVLEEAKRRWPGLFSLGCHVNRKKRNEAPDPSDSAHLWGAALDLGYDGVSVTREQMVGEVMPWLIAHSAELHVQHIMDQGRSWMAYRSMDQAGGWKSYRSKYGNWIHVESTVSGFGDTTPIADRLQDATPGVPIKMPDPIEALRFEPESGEFGLWPIRHDLPTVRRVTEPEQQRLLYDTVRFVQGVILFKAGGLIVVDGQFGRQTDSRVKDLQRFFKLQEDGIVGPKTMAVVQFLAMR